LRCGGKVRANNKSNIDSLLTKHLFCYIIYTENMFYKNMFYFESKGENDYG
jgi:hypothetical protein